jgi:hypothetical protein
MTTQDNFVSSLQKHGLVTISVVSSSLYFPCDPSTSHNLNPGLLETIFLWPVNINYWNDLNYSIMPTLTPNTNTSESLAYYDTEIYPCAVSEPIQKRKHGLNGKHIVLANFSEPSLGRNTQRTVSWVIWRLLGCRRWGLESTDVQARLCDGIVEHKPICLMPSDKQAWAWSWPQQCTPRNEIQEHELPFKLNASVDSNRADT